MTAPRFVDVAVEANGDVAEIFLRFKAEGEPGPVGRVRVDGRWCAVAGWSSANGGSATAAQAIVVEDSSAGTALLIVGGDWGLRLTPADGGAPFAEPYLLLSAAAVAK